MSPAAAGLLAALSVYSVRGLSMATPRLDHFALHELVEAGLAVISDGKAIITLKGAQVALENAA